VSQLLHGAHSDMGLLMGFTTVLFFGTLVAWTFWAYAPWNRQIIDEASRLPFDGEDS